jgi:hypothetical protein
MNLEQCNINEEDIPSVESGTVYEAITELTTGNGQRFSHLSEKERLMFLIHFIGDISQPLHVYGKNRGGNSLKLIRNKNGRNRTTNLHYLWDSEIPQTYIKSGVYKPDLKNTSLIDVINFNLNIGCNKIYKFDDNFIIFEEYYDADDVKNMFDNYASLSVMYL